MTRRSIEIETFQHLNPIPAGTRMGPLLVSSIIPPFNPNSRVLPESVDDQIANVFAKMGEILAAGGAGWEHLAKVNFFVTDAATRDAINGPWAEHFPDPASRPSRHTLVTGVKGPMLVSADFIAWVD